jgi:hypothetical protein
MGASNGQEIENKVFYVHNVNNIEMKLKKFIDTI